MEGQLDSHYRSALGGIQFPNAIFPFALWAWAALRRIVEALILNDLVFGEQNICLIAAFFSDDFKWIFGWLFVFTYLWCLLAFHSLIFGHTWLLPLFLLESLLFEDGLEHPV